MFLQICPTPRPLFHIAEQRASPFYDLASKRMSRHQIIIHSDSLFDFSIKRKIGGGLQISLLKNFLQCFFSHTFDCGGWFLPIAQVCNANQRLREELNVKAINWQMDFTQQFKTVLLQFECSFSLVQQSCCLFGFKIKPVFMQLRECASLIGDNCPRLADGFEMNLYLPAVRIHQWQSHDYATRRRLGDNLRTPKLIYGLSADIR